jgi:hypothetical protein
MILDRTYAEVKAEILAVHPERDFSARGINYMDADQLLAAWGYATARLFRYYVSRPREVWPPEPFGAVHLCEVQCAAESAGHSVVLLADGSVLDPLTPEPRRLTDYYQVHNVALVVPIR